MTNVSKISHPNQAGFSLWIDGDRPFDEQAFWAALTPLAIAKRETVHSSVGPAQIIEKVHSHYGVFHLSREFDEFAGTTIYANDPVLMQSLLNALINSGHYHLSA